jgi:phosphate transport system substrate-binding protein
MMKNKKLASFTLTITCVIALLAVPAAAQAAVQINGSGATFPQPLYESWAEGYKAIAGAQVAYAGGGSSKGKTDIISGTVDFAGSDAPLSDAEAERSRLVQVPSVAGAVVLIYNLRGVHNLIFDGNTLGDIYAGKIAKWNDPALKKLNPNALLPDAPILVAHRSDGSGTTNIFTTYLTKASLRWTETVSPSRGTTVNWPVDALGRGLNGAGNQGVADVVKSNTNAIGYVELSFAIRNRLAYARMVNAAGNTVTPSPASATWATTDAQFDARFASDIANSKQPAAWPITGFTYLLFKQDYEDCDKARTLLQWVAWGIAGYDGRVRATRLGYAALPKDFLPRVEQALQTITCKGAPALR